MVSAFIVSAARPIPRATLGSVHHLTSPRTVISRTAVHRARFHMNVDNDNVTETKAKPAEAEPTTPTFEAPSLDTEVFSNFVDSATEKIESMQQSLQDIDSEQLAEDTKENFKGLIDNLLAGDWLNRGELYGAIQLLFVFLLLRGPGALDGLVSFITGPVLLVTGAVISGKSLLDLGRKQISIWPAPVPDGELKTEGLYSYVRHPVYSGLILASAGYAVATGSPSRLAITAAMAVFLLKKIDVEEEFLRDAYPDYDDYATKVTSKILPTIL